MLCRRRVQELIEHMTQRRDFLVRGIECGKPRRHALQRGPHFDHLDDLLLGLAHDEHTTARHRTQKTLLFEKRHRLANRRATHPELLTQLPLIEPNFLRMRVDVGVHDGLPQRDIRLVAKADVGVQRPQHQQRCGGRV